MQLDNQPQQQQQQELRSIHNRDNSFVRFINISFYKIAIYWMDYHGKPVLYKVLAHREYLDINTFVTHPWIFVDQETNERFYANGRLVHFPEPSEPKNQDLNRSHLPARIERRNVFITTPLRTLRTCCIRIIKRLLRQDSDAYSLELPKCLQNEIFHAGPRKPNRSAALTVRSS